MQNGKSRRRNCRHAGCPWHRLRSRSGRGVTSNGGNSSATIFDTKTLKTLGNVKANGRPDIIYYEPVSRRVFTFNYGTNDTAAIDPAEIREPTKAVLVPACSWPEFDRARE